MKSFIKTSFLSLILIVMFSVGFSNAYAAETTLPEADAIVNTTNNTELTSTTPSSIKKKDCTIVIVYDDGTVVIIMVDGRC